MSEQPKPIPNEEKPVWQSVIEDMTKRNEVGIKRYGTPLQPFNGRNSVQDAMEECLDLVVYLKQYTVERSEMIKLLHEVASLGDMTAKDKLNDISYKAFQLLRKLGEQ